MKYAITATHPWFGSTWKPNKIPDSAANRGGGKRAVMAMEDSGDGPSRSKRNPDLIVDPCARLQSDAIPRHDCGGRNFQNGQSESVTRAPARAGAEDGIFVRRGRDGRPAIGPEPIRVRVKAGFAVGEKGTEQYFCAPCEGVAVETGVVLRDADLLRHRGQDSHALFDDRTEQRQFHELLV